MSDKNRIIELLDKLIPYINEEKYSHDLVDKICTLCLTYVQIKETALFSYVILSIFSEIMNYVDDVVRDLGKSFGVEAKEKEEERLSKHLSDDFIKCLGFIKESPEDANVLKKSLSYLVLKWFSFERDCMTT